MAGRKDGGFRSGQRPAEGGEILVSELKGESQPTGNAGLLSGSVRFSRLAFRDLSIMPACNVIPAGTLSVE